MNDLALPTYVSLPAKQIGSVLGSLTPLLEAQGMGDPIDPMLASNLSNVRGALEDGLRPIDRKALAVLLATTLELWKLPDNWDVIAAFYFEAFEKMPEDIVVEALRRARMNIKWFPKPSELRELAMPLYGHRVRLKAKAALIAHYERESKKPKLVPRKLRLVGRDPLD